MTVDIDLERDLVEAGGRHLVYSVLAAGLAYPNPARIEVITTRMLPALGRLDLPEDVQHALSAVGRSVPVGVEPARADHVVLFPPIASRDAPGYETGYRGEGIFQQADLIADIAGFYRAHGLRAGGSERERPDHIVVELEFMSVLARKEAAAVRAGNDDHVAVCRETSALFLAEHLGCWAPAFGRRAAFISASAWYRALGELTAIWIERDMEHLGVTPVEVVDRPLPQEPPDDGSCGPCPAPGQVT